MNIESSSAAREPDPIARFYSGSVDHRGRTVDAILDWSDERLEIADSPDWQSQIGRTTRTFWAEVDEH